MWYSHWTPISVNNVITKMPFLLTAEDTPEIMSEMARFKSEVCLGNKIECKKGLLKNGTGKGIS